MTRGPSESPLRHRAVVFFVISSLLFPAFLRANPQGAAVRQGQVQIRQTQGQLNIRQQSQRAVIDWESFSIDRGQTTRFLQPNANAAALNRVRGNSASQIEGMLRANGKVYLINPNGILIGPRGSIDVGGFVASTLDVENGKFMKGGDLRFAGNSDAAILNLGSISALDGDVVLMAGSVMNAGTIRAPRGTAALAAGNDILLSETGEERVFVRGSSGAKKAEGVTNTGKIEANIAELKAHGGNIYGIAVKNEGRVAATGVTRKGGQIFLSAGGGKVRSTGTLKAKRADGSGGKIKVDSGAESRTEVGGTIDASGETGAGGEIVLLGKEIEVFDGALILNDGATRGGSTFIGGGMRGQDPEFANAETVTVGNGAMISANAIGAGHGGQVVVFAEGTLRFAGKLSVSGAAGGSGGFAELSGQREVYIDHLSEQVDLGAANGPAGTLLLDPIDVSVINGANNGVVAGTSITDGSIVFFLTNTGNLDIATTGAGGFGDITLANNVNITWGSANHLSFLADRDFKMTGGAVIHATGSGAVSATATRSISLGTAASITTTNGNLTLSANAAGATTGNFIGVDVNGGLVRASGSGVVSVTGKGGTTGGNQYGVNVQGGGDIIGGTGGTLTVNGTGGPAGSGNVGVRVSGSGSTIASGGAHVSVTGQGGSGTGSAYSYGIHLDPNAQITAGGTGNVTLVGTAGSDSTSGNYLMGVVVSNGSIVDSSGGNVSVTGTGGIGTTSEFTGISLDGATITAGGGGTVTVIGNAGTIVGGNDTTTIGVDVRFTSLISSAGGNVSVTGTGGNGTNAVSGANAGVRLFGDGTITAGGTGTVSVTGTGTSGTGVGHVGVFVSGQGHNSNLARIGAANGATTVTATSGNSSSPALVIGTLNTGRITSGTNNPITIHADSMAIGGSATISSGTGMTTIHTRTAGTLINLGGTDVLSGSPLTLGLTDAELDRITAGTLQIGNGNTGPITVSNVITHGNHLSLTTGAGVTINSAITMAANRDLTINALGSTAGTIALANANADLSASGTGAIALSTGRDIALASGSSITTVNGNLTLFANVAGTNNTTFDGIDINGATTRVTGVGNLILTGKGGLGGGADPSGVVVRGGGAILGGTSGSVSVTGTGGSGTSNDTGSSNLLGVLIEGTNSRITSSGAEVQVTGLGGTSTGPAAGGVLLINGGLISAGGNGAVAVTGTGGTGTRFNYGVDVVHSGSFITSNNGPVTVIGTGGSGAGGDHWGVLAQIGGVITAGGNNTVVVTGSGGSGAGGNNHGVVVRLNFGSPGTITSGGGNVTVTGTAGSGGSGNWGISVQSGGTITTATNGGNVILVADRMALANAVAANNSGTVTLRQKTNGVAIDLGSEIDTAAGTLELSDAELDQITAGLVEIGNADTGVITVSSAISHGTPLSLVSGDWFDIHEAITMAPNRNLTLTTTDPWDGYVSIYGGDAQVSTSGSGSVTFDVARGIRVESGGGITTENGNLTLRANTADEVYNYSVGIELIDATLSTVDGTISLVGRGGMDSYSGGNHGIWLRGGSTISATGLGTISLQGFGGVESILAGSEEEGSFDSHSEDGGTNNGIVIEGGSRILSNIGNLTLTGVAGDMNSHGILLSAADIGGASEEETPDFDSRIGANGGTLRLIGTGNGEGWAIAGSEFGVTLGDSADTVVLEALGGDVNIDGVVRGAYLQFRDNTGTGLANFSLGNTDNDADAISAIGSGPNATIGSLHYRDRDGFAVTEFLGGVGLAAVGNITLGSTDDAGDPIIIDRPVTSRGGNIEIEGYDLVVDGSEIRTTGAGIVDLHADRAILVRGDSLLSSVDGKITLSANRSEGSTPGRFTGITVLGSSINSTGLGSIDLRGTGGYGSATPDFAYAGFSNPSSNGIRLDGGSVISAMGSGGIYLEGSGGSGLSGSNGILIENPDTLVQTLSGNLYLYGYGGGDNGGSGNRGIHLLGASLRTGGSGHLHLIGEGGIGSDRIDGIEIGNGGSITVQIGALSLSGTAGGTLGIGIMATTTSGDLRVNGTGSLEIYGSGVNAAGIQLANDSAFLGGAFASSVDLSSLNGDLIVRSTTEANGYINLVAEHGDSFIEGAVTSSEDNIYVAGNNLTIDAPLSAATGDITLQVGYLTPDVVEGGAERIPPPPFSGTASINQTLTAGGNLRYFGGEGDSDTVTFAGYNAAAIHFSFEDLTDIENVVGTGFSGDVLNGPEASSRYEFTGANEFKVGGVAFSAFENLNGGSGGNVFAFTGNSSLGGALDGGRGANTLDYTAYGSGVIVDLPNAVATGIGGGFLNIESFTGSGITDTITGPGSSSVYDFIGLDSMTVGSVWVNGFENLIAGPLADRFVFHPGSRLSGYIDAGFSPIPVVDTLDYSLFGAPVSVHLGLAPRAGATGIAGGFTGINEFFGSVSKNDLFTGLATATTYLMSAPNTFNTSLFRATGFENLTGGPGPDFFRMGPGSGLSGRLSGGTGPATDILSYADFGRAVTVNIGPNTATALGRGFDEIESLVGSSGNDRFNFLNQSTIARVDGGPGSDLFELNDTNLSGDHTYTITSSGISRNPEYAFRNFETVRLFLGPGNNTVDSGFFGFTQIIQGGVGFDTLNLPGITTLNGPNPIRNVYHFEIDGPRPAGTDVGGLLQQQVDQNRSNNANNEGSGNSPSQNPFTVVDPTTLAQVVGNLTGAFSAAVMAQASIISVDGNTYLMLNPFSLDGSGIAPSNLALDALMNNLGVDANMELADAIGYTGALSLVNPDGPYALDLSGIPADPAILQVLQESLAIAAAAELSAALGLNLVVSVTSADGVSPVGLDGIVPGQVVTILLAGQLDAPAFTELNAALGGN